MPANKTAFTYYINPNGNGNTSGTGSVASTASTSLSESNSIHQTSPAWVLTFLRWKVRDTLRTEPTQGLDYSTIADKPLVVENDCVQVSIADSKSVLTPSMTASFLITDVNYETEVAPGDFVFVNILNWEQDARRVANQARNLQAINGINDGFKGFFKVQSVRKSLVTDTNSGTKSQVIKITGFAFTEFNNSIYFNPYLLSGSDQNNLLFASQIGLNWANMQTDKGLTKIQYVIQFLINSFIGSGFTDIGRKTDPISPASFNTQFYMPNGVGSLLGLPQLQSAKDAYNYLFGIQTYSAGQAQTLAQGMNPQGVPPDATDESRFITLPNLVEGDTVTKPEYWNQVKAWSILNQFTNAPLNELYTCFRVSPNGSVMPTMVLRQIPFTNDNFVADNYVVTRFMSLPRWDISPALAFSFDLGRDEALRMNFVQYYGRSVTGPQGFDISDEISGHNYLYDLDDVKRNGLRPYVVTSEFDRLPAPPYSANGLRSPGWAKIVGDALIGGHLKMSGTISFVGIVEPIAVGDNLQFDGIIYHIEQISHSAIIQPNGHKTFRTTVTVSNGLSIGTGNDVLYGEMKYGSAYDKRASDYNNSQILPGVSEAQDTVYREPGVDVPHSGADSFIEPNIGTSINKFTRDT